MKPIRTLLFVPGHKEKWVDKIPTFGADATVIDLEDSVPNDQKARARAIAAEAIPDLAKAGQRLYVRINPTPFIYDLEDLHAVIQPGLEGLMLPKANGPESVDTLASIVSDIELRKGMDIGHTNFIPALETARSMQLAYEIALHPRIGTLVAASAKNADVGRALGFQWTPEGLETLYFKSRVVMAVRAAGKHYPLGGLWQDVHDLKGLRKSCEFNRQLGCTGEIILHPSNVPVANEVYTPSDDEIAYFKGMIEAFESAEKAGHAAVMYDGEHIDYAHVKTARQALEAVALMKK